ncbi:hypothetical protein ACUODJ_16135, partial [Escherichia sp. HC-CC]
MGSEISKKDITRLGFRSSLLQASFNYERMQAGDIFFTDFRSHCCSPLLHFYWQRAAVALAAGIS